MLVPLLIAAVVGYLLGSLPFGYLVARAKGVNIFEVGSKSPGATNVRRVLGPGPGNLVLILDALKGAAAAGWPQLFWVVLTGQNVRGGYYAPSDEKFAVEIAIVGLVAALIGHAFSCFTKFRGGKGVATAAGGFFAGVGGSFLSLYYPGSWNEALSSGQGLMAVALVIFARWNPLAGVALTVAAWLLHRPPLILGASAVAMLFVIVRHRTNISRLLAGTESKVGQNKRGAESP